MNRGLWLLFGAGAVVFVGVALKSASSALWLALGFLMLPLGFTSGRKRGSSSVISLLGVVLLAFLLFGLALKSGIIR